MRIVVASSYVPFRHDRNARLVTELTATLCKHGYQAEAVLLPYQPIDAEPIEQTLGFRLFDLSDSGGTPTDQLIAIGEPAHALPHAHKKLWVVGSCRGKHPLFARGDALFRQEARKVFYAFPPASVAAETPVLYPPLIDTRGLEPADAEPQFIWAGSMYGDARPELALEAMLFVRPGYKLVLMPEGLSPRARAGLDRRIQEWDLGSRVDVIPDPSPAQRRERLRRSLGCLCVGLYQEAPEDAVIEAFHARVPVLTVVDSGAPSWIIEPNVIGIKVEPSPRLLAMAMNRLATDPAYRRRIGEGGALALRRHNISWDYVAESLVA